MLNLLSTAHRVLDGKEVTRLEQDRPYNEKHTLTQDETHFLYKSCHVNHPSNIWLRQSKANYEWLYDMWCMFT